MNNLSLGCDQRTIGAISLRGSTWSTLMFHAHAKTFACARLTPNAATTAVKRKNHAGSAPSRASCVRHASFIQGCSLCAFPSVHAASFKDCRILLNKDTFENRVDSETFVHLSSSKVALRSHTTSAWPEQSSPQHGFRESFPQVKNIHCDVAPCPASSWVMRKQLCISILRFVDDVLLKVSSPKRWATSPIVSNVFAHSRYNMLQQRKHSLRVAFPATFAKQATLPLPSLPLPLSAERRKNPSVHDTQQKLLRPTRAPARARSHYSQLSDHLASHPGVTIFGQQAVSS